MSEIYFVDKIRYEDLTETSSWIVSLRTIAFKSTICNKVSLCIRFSSPSFRFRFKQKLNLVLK